ncbi:hypothetical protein H5V45_11700 [Nocardioides sp. KIGAM211]|uniref:Uncharacterized protein n=1 Tax=Nocardioides luti TaxID=2761101 RepID=A0A7X0RGQ3_9ACTN|nr:hypothetical protein [Nocardioides luti]MBB6627981.1 hypothetical protein [Nocardioides luti]
MKPLQSVAMGLVIVVLSARFGGYDALADPVGWLLVYLGVRALPADLDRRSTLLGLAALAGVVASVVWFPVVTADLYDADASLGWAANLPQLAFSALLCHVLAARAAAAGDGRAARWLGITRSATIVVALLPVLVFGGGLVSFELTSYLAAGLVALTLIWLLFSYAGRTWTGPVGQTAAREASAS